MQLIDKEVVPFWLQGAQVSLVNILSRRPYVVERQQSLWNIWRTQPALFRFPWADSPSGQCSDRQTNLSNTWIYSLRKRWAGAVSTWATCGRDVNGKLCRTVRFAVPLSRPRTYLGQNGRENLWTDFNNSGNRFEKKKEKLLYICSWEKFCCC